MQDISLRSGCHVRSKGLSLEGVYRLRGVKGGRGFAANWLLWSQMLGAPRSWVAYPPSPAPNTGRLGPAYAYEKPFGCNVFSAAVIIGLHGPTHDHAIAPLVAGGNRGWGAGMHVTRIIKHAHIPDR